MKAKTLLLILTGLFLTTLFGCCGPAIPSAPEIQYAIPPGSLLTDCTAPKFEGRTNEDLVKFVASYREALNNCNADKRSLREWSGMYQAKTENGNVNN